MSAYDTLKTMLPSESIALTPHPLNGSVTMDVYDGDGNNAVIALSMDDVQQLILMLGDMARRETDVSLESFDGNVVIAARDLPEVA